MATNGISIVFGGGSFWRGTVDEISSWLDVLEKAGIKKIDTAEVYGQSQYLLGKAGAPSRFIIDSKAVSGMGPNPSTAEVILEAGRKSLELLGTDSLDVYYLHSPDTRVPWKDTLTGLNELYKQGAFKRLGLSNFTAKQIDEFVQVAKENNFVVPSVYQGHYSPVARKIEDDVIPTLRRHNMSLYSYSPSAGGFLTRPKEALLEGRLGKKDEFGAVSNALYNKPSFIAALDTWARIARDEGVELGELAYRWVVYHSQLRAASGDAIIAGASKQHQLVEAVEWMKKGPLSDAAAQRVDAMWDDVRAEAATHNMPDGMKPSEIVPELAGKSAAESL
ncbi:aflatoxin B1 aldehyde reductase member 3 [Pyricularia oryzae 70-15]|uniref:Aflatoxin B1 aldehyde reductase member 3 n=3 Tax=Pyricularia oryzae TaxID=318829 RepID=G4NAQ9_PYRO7|nr:aflatoxin B1 aldehyde reductase member 3 [Pyricularia oryzae 70-15]EHA49702.1 aflatoxin B1 aldehyde reductase member 3 [Pyricularia oryzae 70-15]ELQ36708.1 aflatoxin B1 aldehyde reductase member 3 [Pyricularia oryzae Y34]KAI7909324.1 aflatoxin B1 aldehyde reductase member 3 [Pyricularia oryzae]KAI7913353.1 aflatoxin B1 aldehyde reductase member 3 [Pyricularia oryzae]